MTGSRDGPPSARPAFPRPDLIPAILLHRVPLARFRLGPPRSRHGDFGKTTLTSSPRVPPRAAANGRARSPRRPTSIASSSSQPARVRSSPPRAAATLTGCGTSLDPGGAHQQPPGLAVRLEIHPGDQPVAEQERQHVVAPAPLRLGHVDLDRVVEAEQPGDPWPAPDQRVERRQQRGGFDPPRQPGGGVEEGRLGPALHRDLAQLAAVHQLGEPPASLADRHPPVVGQIAGAAHAVRPRRAPQQLALGFRGRRPRGPGACVPPPARRGRSGARSWAAGRRPPAGQSRSGPRETGA